MDEPKPDTNDIRRWLTMLAAKEALTPAELAAVQALDSAIQRSDRGSGYQPREERLLQDGKINLHWVESYHYNLDIAYVQSIGFAGLENNQELQDTLADATIGRDALRAHIAARPPRPADRNPDGSYSFSPEQNREAWRRADASSTVNFVRSSMEKEVPVLLRYDRNGNVIDAAIETPEPGFEMLTPGSRMQRGDYTAEGRLLENARENARKAFDYLNARGIDLNTMPSLSRFADLDRDATLHQDELAAGAIAVAIFNRHNEMQPSATATRSRGQIHPVDYGQDFSRIEADPAYASIVQELAQHVYGDTFPEQSSTITNTPEADARIAQKPIRLR